MPVDFTPWSLTHALVLTCMALAICVGVRWRATRRTPEHRTQVDRAIGALLLGLWILINGWYVWPGHFVLAQSLPLHICDLVSLWAPLALLTNSRPARSLLYFWGIALCSQAYVTPTLTEGPALPAFWLFWGAHFIILFGVAYDLWARFFRPTQADLRLAVIASLFYAACIVPFDMISGTNYGYLGPSQPEQPTLIDYLGPWPVRVPVMIILGVSMMTIAYLPWRVLQPRAGAAAP